MSTTRARTNPSATCTTTKRGALLAYLGGEVQGHTLVPDDILRKQYEQRMALIAENEALRKDAARYQWLRDKSESVHPFYLEHPDMVYRCSLLQGGRGQLYRRRDDQCRDTIHGSTVARTCGGVPKSPPRPVKEPNSLPSALPRQG